MIRFFLIVSLFFLSTAHAADTESEIVQKLATCLLENAPDGWESVSVVYSRNGVDSQGTNKVSVAHQLIIGGEIRKLEPCRPLIPAMLVEKLSKALPENSQNWRKATVTVFNSGKFKVDWEQP